MAGDRSNPLSEDVNMLNSLQQTGKDIGHKLHRARENRSEGWQQLLSRSSSVLTVGRPRQGSDSAKSIPVS